jgi:hypothetical protein
VRWLGVSAPSRLRDGKPQARKIGALRHPGQRAAGADCPISA